MLCYPCAELGTDRFAVALCRSCQRGALSLRDEPHARHLSPRHGDVHRAAAAVYVLTPSLPSGLTVIADAAEDWLEKHVEERFALPLTSYAVDPRSHASGVQRP